jgi:uncharacterized membrane protein YkvA (DUF1232 family)
LGCTGAWRQLINSLKNNLYVIYFAYKDPRVPWYAKFLAILAVAYAFSLIDLIPDFIPILGLLDDLIILPLGIMMVLKLIPDKILAEYKEKAPDLKETGKPKNYIAALIIITIWIAIVWWGTLKAKTYFE